MGGAGRQDASQEAPLTAAKTTAQFYSDLKHLPDFAALAEPGCFAPLPPDWVIVIADIEGSTGAIEAGRYRDVNLLGAACIATLEGVAGGEEFPFVFGGDGASAAIPSGWLPDAAAQLAGLQRLARDQYQLGLRVGFVPAQELLDAGHPVEVARLVLAGARSIALFRGGGLHEAEARVKADPARYTVASAAVDPELTTISCRWQPIPSQRGKVVSLLVEATGPAPDRIYAKILAEIQEVFGGKLESAMPVHEDGLRFRPLGELVAQERRALAGWWSWTGLVRLAHAVLGSLFFGLGLATAVPMLRNYLHQTGMHSDYRKFDDMLRMVLDCTDAQRAGLRALLERARAEGSVIYGIHESDHALMTCMVESFSEGGHLHFIDGSDGGYALAARQLKAQRKESVGPDAGAS